MATDPTLDFVTRLNDPSRWILTEGVPVFKPHTRTIPERKIGDRVFEKRVIKVTEKDLEPIVNELKELEAQGIYQAITPGHKDPTKPETEQPPIIGYYRNPRVGKFGPKGEPAILMDEQISVEHADTRKDFPWRSAEYFPDRKDFFGIALLKRRPALNLGTVTYTDRGVCYHYAMGSDGAVDDDQAPVPGAAMGARDATMPGAAGPIEQTTPEEEKLFEKFRAYMCKTYALDPKWPQSSEPAPTEPGAKPGETGEPDDDDTATEKVTPMATTDVPVNYAAQIAELKARIDGKELEIDQERCDKLLYSLEGEGFQFSKEQRDKELKKLCSLPRESREERVGELRLIYQNQRMPEGRIPLHRGHVEGGEVDEGNPFAEPKYHGKAMQYMLAHPGVSYDAAVEYVTSKNGDTASVN